MRLSASLIMARPSGLDSFEILFVRRSPTARFMPNMCVFPGGAVDRSDGTHEDTACRVAAIRETFEETGLFYRNPNDVREVFTDNVSELTEIAASLQPVCVWQTPIEESSKLGPKGGFRTKFYFAINNCTTSGTCDGKETTDVMWVNPKRKESHLFPIPQQYLMNEFAKCTFSQLSRFVVQLHEGLFRYPYYPVMVSHEGRVAYAMPGDYQHELHVGGQRWIHRAYEEGHTIRFIRSKALVDRIEKGGNWIAKL